MTNINRRRFPILLASALTLLAILGALFLPDRAQAQTATTLVSNIGQAADGSNIFAGSRAQSFTTGSNADGYTLTGVDIVVTNTGDFAAKVCETDSSGYPTSTCTDLTAPGTIAVGTLSFTAPADTTLVKETTYAVVATANSISSLGRTSSDAEDTGHQADWRIADAYDQFSTDSWSTTTTGRSIRIAIKGYAAGGDTPTLSTDATLSGLSLGTGVTLSPAFASGTATYTASVANSVDEVTVTPTTNHASATVEILDTDDNELDDADDVEDDFQVALSVGDTVIKVKVTAEDGTSTQTYTVTVTRDDFPADTTTTGQVDVGGSVTGTIEIGDDQDWFAVDLEAGTRYQIDLEGVPTGRGTLADPILQAIRDSSGIVVSLNTYNDDGGVGANARYTYTPVRTGTRHLVASAVSGSVGTYTLSVILLGANGASEADTDFPATTATTGRVEVGASATGNITTPDFDWFRVDLEAGKTYQFDLEGEPTERGILEDPVLGLYDDSSNVIVTNDDASDTTLNSQIVHTATATGTYYLEVNSVADTRDGTYTLSVRDITTPSCTLNTGDVWCGVVTVGTFMIGGTSHLGYLDGTDGGGMLSDNDFEFTDTDLDSASHTITAVALASGTLSLVFEDSQDEDDKPVLDTWDLQVGTDTFALDGDDVTQLPTGGYQLTGTGLSWSVGDTVTLRLRGETGPPSVANVAVTSMPLLTSSGGSEQDTYGAGDEIEFTVTFSQAVVVTGDPQFGVQPERGEPGRLRLGQRQHGAEVRVHRAVLRLGRRRDLDRQPQLRHQVAAARLQRRDHEPRGHRRQSGTRPVAGAGRSQGGRVAVVEADAQHRGRRGDRGQQRELHGDAVGGGDDGRDGDLDGVDRDRRHGGRGGPRNDEDGDGYRRDRRHDGNVRGAGGERRHRRGRRDLHGDAVEPDER